MIYLNHIHLADQTIQSTEDEAGLKVPLNHCPLLEVRLQPRSLGEVHLTIEVAYLESVCQLLQPFIWLHAKDFF